MTQASITFPQPGRLTLKGANLLASPESDECAVFVETLFSLPDVGSIEINARRASADIRFDRNCTIGNFAKQLNEIMKRPSETPSRMVLDTPYVDHHGRVQLYRIGHFVSSWKIQSDLPNRLRIRHPKLLRRKGYCHEVERELMTVHGVDRFKVNAVTSSVLVIYDASIVDKTQLVQIMANALNNAENRTESEEGKYELALCTVTVGLAASAQFMVPSLLIPAGALFLYCGIPTFISAWKVLTKERRLGVDVLDGIVIIMCLLSAQLFAGAVLTWCLSFGRKLLARAREDSRRRLVNVFGKQPRSAYVLVNGVEINVPLDSVREGDVVAVHTGEMIPVDGIVSEGDAVVDQHALTGESVAVEKQQGSRVYASTMLVGGRILIRVEKAGKETTFAKISTILNDTASFRLASQSKGEAYADDAVLPTLALSALGYGTVGLQGATAIINCDFGTGIRMAAPIGLLSCLSLCANRGILVKDGSALEEMSSIDTVLFDKTGTLTQERPVLHKIHSLADGWSEDQILMYAAAAEKRVGHPIAVAIVAASEQHDMTLPKTDETSFKVGYGISVTAGGKRIHVGSSRYLTLEGFDIGEEIDSIADAAYQQGHSMVFTAVDDVVIGGIELAPSLREGIVELFNALRAQGIKQIVIISGDHEVPTANLAKQLDVDRYFAEVLPEDKARYVEILQREGRKVCFVGDGINDSIALKKANVSISLRGATTVATDTAQVVFMEESLNRLVDFMAISRQLDVNVRTSWYLILVPNLLCIGGAFFLKFGVMASVLANNVAALAALANGLLPLRKLSEEPKATLLLKQIRGGHQIETKHSGNLSSANYQPFPSIPNARRVAAMTMIAGFGGLVLPIFPGWLFLFSSVGLLAAQDPRLKPLDLWLKRKFPLSRNDALYFFKRFLEDYQKMFPNSNGENVRQSTSLGPL